MIKKILFCLLLVSCGRVYPTEDPQSDPLEPQMSLDYRWICHNPGHDLHGQLCIEEIDTLRGTHQPCFWSITPSHDIQATKNPDSFCWLLERKDCIPPLYSEWQEKNCHFFD